jgi:hypothetical protein
MLLVKVGMTTDLKKRLDTYLLYYPRAVVLFGLIETSTNQAKAAERDIQRYLKKKGRQATFPHTHSDEWYFVSLRDIKIVLEMQQKPKHTVRIFDPVYIIRENMQLKRDRIQTISTPQKKVIDQSHVLKINTWSSSTKPKRTRSIAALRQANTSPTKDQPGRRLRF